MRTNPQARYRHSGKSGHADRRSYHKTPARPTWTIEEIEAAMLAKIAAGDEFWAGYRAKQLVTRLREAGAREVQTYYQEGEWWLDPAHYCDTEHDPDCAYLQPR